jgi:hypothetical protein
MSILAAWLWLTPNKMDSPTTWVTGLGRALLVTFLGRMAIFIGDFQDENFSRWVLVGHVSAGIDDGGMDEKAMPHVIEQRVTEGRLAILETIGAV